MRKPRSSTIDQGTPDYTKRPPQRLREIEVPDGTRAGFPPGTPVRAFILGGCTVLVTRSLERWHLSINHRDRYPNWDEIAEAVHRILPRGVWMALHAPPVRDYINIRSNCFQLVETAPLPREI
jgi:hypothetical protein